MKIGFIGCGNLASAMIGGILKKGIVKKEEIIVSNLTEAGSRRSREKLGVETTMDNRQVVTQAEIVFLAVKPQFYEEVLKEIKDLLTEKHILVGIAPGKTLKWLWLPGKNSTSDAQYSGSGGRRHDSRLLQRPGDGGGSAKDQRDCRKLWKI